jgi:type III secretion protein C
VVAFTARDQPIGSFLRDLFSQAGGWWITSPVLTGTAAASSIGPGDKVHDVAAFNLTGYDDAASSLTAHPAGELRQRPFDVGLLHRSVVRGVAGLA